MLITVNGGVISLLVPYVVFNIILIAFHALMSGVAGNVVQALVVAQQRVLGIFCGWRFDHKYCCYLWFLPCLAWCKLGMHYVLRLSRLWQQDVVAVILVGIGIALKCAGIKQLPLCVDIALIAFAFVYVGYRCCAQLKRRLSPAFIVPLAATFVAAFVSNYELSGETQVGFFSGEFGIFPLFFIAAFAGTISCIQIAKSVGHSRLLAYLGRNSLTIYVLHYIPLEILWVVVNKVYPQCSGSVAQAIAVGVLLAIVVLLTMVPIITIVDRRFAWTLGRKLNFRWLNQ